MYNLQLRRLRKAKRITLKDISNVTGVSISHLCRVEKGEKLLTFPLACSIAEYLEVSLDELAGRRKEQ